MNLLQYFIINADIVLTPFAILTVATYIRILFYLKKDMNSKSTLDEWNFFWFVAIIEYRNCTKRKNGKVGILFYVFCVSILVTLSIFITLAVCSFITDPIHIDQEGNIIQNTVTGGPYLFFEKYQMS